MYIFNIHISFLCRCENTKLYEEEKQKRVKNGEIDLEFVAQNIDGDDIEFLNSPERDPPRVNISEKRFFLQASVSFH